MSKQNLYNVKIKEDTGTSDFFIHKKENGKIHIQLDSCIAECSVKQAKEVMESIRKAILDSNGFD